MSDNTMAFYNANALAYATASKVNPRLSSFLARCVEGGKILELGTGSGHDARAMIEAGFVVDATDASAELATVASRHIGQPVQVMRFQDLNAEQAYDGIYASASLLHAPRRELTGIIRALHKALRPAGVVWASFKTGAGEGDDQLGRYYNFLSPDELAAHWQQAAVWSHMWQETWRGAGYDKVETGWIGITAVR